MTCDIYSGQLARLRADLLVLVCFEDQRPLQGLSAELDWLFSGLFSRVLMQRPFFGHVGDRLLVPTSEKLQIPKTLLLGMGAVQHYDEKVISKMSAVLCELIPKLGVRDCAFELSPFQRGNINDEAHIEGLLSAFVEAGLSEQFQFTFVSHDRTRASVLQQKARNESLFTKSKPPILSATVF